MQKAELKNKAACFKTMLKFKALTPPYQPLQDEQKSIGITTVLVTIKE